MNLCFIENFCRSSDSEVLWFPLRGRTLAPEITIPPGGCSRETRQTRVTAVWTILQGDTAHCSTLLSIFRLRPRPSCTLNTETASTSSAWLLAVLLICRYNISIYHTTSNMLQLIVTLVTARSCYLSTLCGRLMAGVPGRGYTRTDKTAASPPRHIATLPRRRPGPDTIFCQMEPVCHSASLPHPPLRRGYISVSLSFHSQPFNNCPSGK